MVLFFDIETNGLLRPNEKRQCTKVHCIVTLETFEDGGRTRWYYDDPVGDGVVRQGSIEEGVRDLEGADLLIGHGIQDFDIPALRRVYPGTFTRAPKLYDTLVASRLMFPDIKGSDFGRMRHGFPAKLKGSHKLEAWGHRLGVRKGDFAHDAEKDESLWDELSLEMLQYCEQDVFVTRSLYEHLQTMRWPERSVEIEHEFARRIGEMMSHGVGFDMPAAHRLEDSVKARLRVREEELKSAMGSKVVEWVTPKRGLHRSKVVERNPGSRQQVIEFLREEYGWEPVKFTADGAPQLDEAVIAGMDEAQVPLKPALLDFFKLRGVLGRLSKGRHAFVKHAVPSGDGRYKVHGFCNHNGAYTGRCTHSFPNMNVPRVGSFFGQEFRSLFVPFDPENVLVGCDMSGIEARVIAHYLSYYDSGKFARRVEEGDIHQENADMIGIPRQDAKNVLYAVSYGALPAKVGAMLGASARRGGEVRKAVLRSVPGLSHLIEDVQARVRERGYLVGLDGRRMRPRKVHSAFNTLVQSGGAVVMKVATARAHELVGDRARMVLHVHDEYQWECSEGAADEVGGHLEGAVREAGKILGLQCALDAESKVGRTWAETH